MSLETWQLDSSAMLHGSENYSQWKRDMLRLLLCTELEEYIDVLTVKPEASAGATPEAIRLWKTNNAKAKLLMMRNMDPELATMVDIAETAVEMWQQLQRRFMGSLSYSRQRYLSEMLAIDYKQFSTIPAFIGRFRCLIADLEEVEMSLPDEAYRIIFIKALSTTYPTWAERQMLFARTETTPTLSALYADIVDEARAAKPSVSVSTTGSYGKKEKRSACSHCHKYSHDKNDCWELHPEKAPWKNGKTKPAHMYLVNSGLNKASSRHLHPEKMPEKSSKKENLTCSYCSKQGHSKDECWNLHPEKMPDKLSKKENFKCSHCSEHGHSRDECWSLHPEKTPVKHCKKENLTCSQCNKPGHNKDDCLEVHLETAPEKNSKQDKDYCLRCNKSDHSHEECWLLHPEKRPGKKNSQNHINEEQEKTDEELSSNVLPVKLPNVIVFPNREDLLVDLGDSHPIIPTIW